MEYPKRFRLGQKGTIGYQEHANKLLNGSNKPSMRAKFVQNARSNVHHLITSVACVESALKKSNTLSMSPTLLNPGKD